MKTNPDKKSIRLKYISKRAQNILVSPIKEMSILADEARARGGLRIIPFGQGVPYFDTPEYIKREIIESLRQKDTRAYTLMPGISELRDLVARRLECGYGIKNIDSRREVMITVGCQEAIACALSAVIDVGDEVILFTPGFASHIQQVIHFGGKPKFAALKEADGWAIDFNRLERTVTKRTKAILFANPANPTGKVLTPKETKLLAGFAKRHDLVIISDETYDFLVYDGASYLSPAAIPETRNRIIVCGSFSKKYALTGYRIGYSFANSGITSQMMKVHDALVICSPAISQKAAIAALKDAQASEESTAGFVKGFSDNRQRMCERFDGLKNIFSYQKPMGAYYIFAKYDYPKLDSRQMALKILNDTRVVVVPGSAFGPTGENHLRFSFGGTPEEIDEGFDRLDKWAALLR